MFGFVSGLRYLRESIISGLIGNKLTSPMIYKGTANTKLVITWVKELLLPNLNTNSILIWDNASTHKSKELIQLVEKAGHIMLFLPPYSPDLNPIEHKWNELKQRLCKRKREINNIDLNFTELVIECVNSMTRSERV